jgi:hypothetical protein
MKMIQDLDCYKRAGFKPRIVSTGHSLGGGLAQFVALATKSGGPRIAKVFAFDSSPVTGAHLVDKRLREENAVGLTVDHVYESGEVLSLARRLAQEYPPLKSRCNPLVRSVEVKAARGSATGLHGIPLLATNLADLSYNDGNPMAYLPPDTVVDGCKARYRDEEEVIVAGARRPRAVFGSGTQRTFQASADNYGGYADHVGASYALVAQQDQPAARSTSGKVHRVVFTSGGRKSKNLRVANSL